MEAKGTYTDAGASAIDTLDGNLTGSVMSVSTVNTDAVGSYSVTYSVSDAQWQRSRTGGKNGEGSGYNQAGDHAAGQRHRGPWKPRALTRMAGASASDILDGNLTGSVTSVSTVNTDAVGSYTVTYSVSDTSSNAADSVVRTVNVVDTTKPVITLLGNSTVQHEALIEFNDPGVTVIDSIDGNLVATVTGSVDVNTVGTYILKYGATDTSGNTATEVQRIVTVGDTGAL